VCLWEDIYWLPLIKRFTAIIEILLQHINELIVVLRLNPRIFDDEATIFM
jgi:hypothetical protein